ncbi:MAG: DUF1592 domain-containing protein [Myxococcota bacterium]
MPVASSSRLSRAGQRAVLMSGVLLSPAAVAGCYSGFAQPPSGQVAEDDVGDGADGGAEGDEDREHTGAPGRLRRLTRIELDNVLHDLFGTSGVAISGVAIAGLELDPQVGAFYNAYEDLWADRAFLQKYLAVIDQVAEQASLDIAALYPCAWDQDGQVHACVEGLLEELGTRMFRRPITGEELDRYAGAFASSRQEYTVEESLSSMLQAMLLSPAFLYRDETLIGQQADSSLAQYQMASQLSFTLWATMPDEPLLAAAEAGALATREQILAQAERMLQSPRARDGLVQFFEQLFDHPKYRLIDKDPQEHPEFDPELLAAMQQEMRDFVAHVVFDGEGTLDELLTAPYSLFGPRLASIYGVTADDASVPTALPASERAGLLTQPGFLAYSSPVSGTKPVHRGNFVLERLLCIELGPPPEDMLMLPEDVADADATTREKFELHVERESCRACHQYIDPIGFGLEQYDGLGRYRTEEDGHPVDAQGDLLGAGSQDGSFVGGRELAERLAASEVTHGCFARQYARYVLGRRELEDDLPEIDRLVERFVDSGRELKTLTLGLVGSELFLDRFKP